MSKETVRKGPDYLAGIVLAVRSRPSAAAAVEDLAELADLLWQYVPPHHEELVAAKFGERRKITITPPPHAPPRKKT